MIASCSKLRIGAFVRRFFYFLEGQGIRAAVLHGGEDGFEEELSDVDFTVDAVSFGLLPVLIREYCHQSGWRLCQVLRHETTAAFFVCSALDDPACAVALDACSDYLRNGSFFLSADFLLKERRSLSWGGFGLSPGAELKYRFAKAAAKSKDPITAAAEFSGYPKEVRSECALWLEECWDVAGVVWDEAGLRLAFERLRAKVHQGPLQMRCGSAARILSRVLKPTGMVVVCGHEDYEARSASLERVFGHLYFRRVKKGARFRAAFLKDLIASTLIVVSELRLPWSLLVPADCVFRPDPADHFEARMEGLAFALQQRAELREAD